MLCKLQKELTSYDIKQLLEFDFNKNPQMFITRLLLAVTLPAISLALFASIINYWPISLKPREDFYLFYKAIRYMTRTYNICIAPKTYICSIYTAFKTHIYYIHTAIWHLISLSLCIVIRYKIYITLYTYLDFMLHLQIIYSYQWD